MATDDASAASTEVRLGDRLVGVDHEPYVIAELSAKIGALENQKGEISFLVGQYLSNNLDSRDPAVQHALRPFRPLISRIKYLKASIQYNQRLARRNR